MSALRVAGVDEAGRGPLAGPVFAAAVILDPRRPIEGLRDSKQLNAAVREQLALRIRADALCWSVAWADSEEIDTLNILQATHLAMRRALLGLRLRVDRVLVDGNRLPAIADLCGSAEAIVKGDRTVPAISAASILAKTGRDARMAALRCGSSVNARQTSWRLRRGLALSRCSSKPIASAYAIISTCPRWCRRWVTCNAGAFAW